MHKWDITRPDTLLLDVNMHDKLVLCLLLAACAPRVPCAASGCFPADDPAEAERTRYLVPGPGDAGPALPVPEHSPWGRNTPVNKSLLTAGYSPSMLRSIMRKYNRIPHYPPPADPSALPVVDLYRDIRGFDLRRYTEGRWFVFFARNNTMFPYHVGGIRFEGRLSDAEYQRRLRLQQRRWLIYGSFYGDRFLMESTTE